MIFVGRKDAYPVRYGWGAFVSSDPKSGPTVPPTRRKKSRKGHPRRFLSWLLPRRGFLPRHDAARLGDHDARASRRGALRAVSRPRRALVRRRARHLGDLLGASRPRLSEARRSLRARSSRLDPRRPPPPPPPRARVSLRHGGVRGGAPRRGRARAPPRPPRRAPGGLPPTLRRDGGARARPDVALRRVGRAAESNGGEFSTRTHATVPPFPRSARVAPRRCSVRDGPPRRRRRRVRRVRLRARLPQIPTRPSPPPRPPPPREARDFESARHPRGSARIPPSPLAKSREEASSPPSRPISPSRSSSRISSTPRGTAVRRGRGTRPNRQPRARTRLSAALTHLSPPDANASPLPSGVFSTSSTSSTPRAPSRTIRDSAPSAGPRRRVGAVDVAVRAGSPTARVRRVGARTFQRAAKRTWFPRRRRWTRRFESRWKTRRRC